MIEDRLTLNFEIAERLRFARTCANLTQVQLAERTNGQVSMSMIGSYEGAQRRMGIEEARLLAAAMGTVSPGFLLCLDDPWNLSPDEIELLAQYRATDARGRIEVQGLAASEARRVAVEVHAT